MLTRRIFGGRTAAAIAGLAATLSVTMLLATQPAGAQTDEPPVIAGAADLQFALTEIAEAFTVETGKAVKLSFGSSGNFSRQIREGAPFQIYLSADEKYVLDLAKDGLARDEGSLYALGRIVLIVPTNSPLKADASFDDLAAALEDGRLAHFAIANPEHAPYGLRAMEALKHRGLWEKIEAKLVFGENVSQAAQFATSGDAQGGIIAYSLALSPKVAVLGEYALIPDDWHEPLKQRMVLLKNAGRVAEEFYNYMQGKPARTIMRKFGFTLPGETG